MLCLVIAKSGFLIMWAKHLVCWSRIKSNTLVVIQIDCSVLQISSVVKDLASSAGCVQMAVWYRASASGSVDLGFDSKSGTTNDLKINIHSFPA